MEIRRLWPKPWVNFRRNLPRINNDSGRCEKLNPWSMSLSQRLSGRQYRDSTSWHGLMLAAPVKRRYRVRENARIQEIRRQGRSYADRLLVLCVLPNELAYSRFGFSVSKRIGNAVLRNQIRRRLREVTRLRMAEIDSGWDIVFIARRPIRSADYREMDAACARLLRRANLLPASRESGPECAQ